MPSDQRKTHCLYCNHRVRIRLKAGNYFTCPHCKQVNPGPRMMKAMVGHFTKTVTPAASPPAPIQRLKPRLNGVKPAPVKANTAPAPKASVHEPKPPDANGVEKGILQRVFYG